jgi:hypothetical protein
MMMRVQVPFFLFGVFVLGTCAAGAAVTDFSGTWILDRGKSQGSLDQSTWIIKQNEKEISITSDDVVHFASGSSGSKNGTKIYKLDGSETTKEGAMSVLGGANPEPSHQAKIKEKAKWVNDGKVLELIRLTELGDGIFTETVRLELADNGKTLRVQSSSESTSSTMPKRPGGDYVYSKK